MFTLRVCKSLELYCIGFGRDVLLPHNAVPRSDLTEIP